MSDSLRPGLHRQWHTERGGAPAREVVVLLGSLASDTSMWVRQAEALSASYDVLVVDNRGHGRSPLGDRPYTIDLLAEDVLAVLDDEGIDSAHVIGLSLGGMLALRLAAAAPERVRTLTVLCTSAHFVDGSVFLERAEAATTVGMTAVADATLLRWFTPGFAERAPEVVRQCREMILATDPEAYAQSCRAIAGMDLRPLLGGIRIPALVIAGSADTSTPPPHLEQIAALLPQSTYVELPGAHFAQLECADQVNELVRAHLHARDDAPASS